MTERGVVVDVSNRQRRLKTSASWVRRLVREACAAIGIEEAEISVLLVGDAAMAKLNEEWLEHQGPTDVITFGLSEPTDEVDVWPGGLSGDIVVSTETACRMVPNWAGLRRTNLPTTSCTGCCIWLDVMTRMPQLG